jgi:hypothetical protein
MAWPVSPTAIDQIPHPEDYDIGLVGVVELITPGVAAMLCKYVTEYRESLEELTQGDPTKEQALGQHLIHLSYLAASVAPLAEIKNKLSHESGVPH